MNSIFRHVKDNSVVSAVVLLSALGLLLRAWYLYDFSGSVLFRLAVGPDVSEYDEAARAILGGTGDPNFHHAPLYSYFLARLYQLTGDSIPAVRAIQLLLNWAIQILLYYSLPFRNAKLKLVFLALAMCYPVLFYFQAELVSESLLYFLLCAAAVFYFRKRFFWSGLLGGLAVITHPMALLFVILVALHNFWRQNAKRALLYLTAVLLAVIPVSVSRSLDAGHFILVQSGGMFNLWLGNNPDANGGCYLRPGAEWKQVHADAEAAARSGQITVDRVYLDKIADFVTAEPAKELKLLFTKACLVWMPKELISGADPEYVYKKTNLVRYLGGGVIVIFILSFYGLYVAMQKRRRQFDYFYLWLFSFYLMQILTVTAGRYRMAMFPAVFVFAALGAMRFRWRYYWPLLAAGGLLSAVLNFNFAYNEETAALYGEANYRLGNFDHAIELLRGAERSINDPDRFGNLIAFAEWRRGNIKAAEAALLSTIDRTPDSPRAKMNLANLYAVTDRAEQARQLYESTLRDFPLDANLQYNYALFLFNSQQIAAAEQAYLQLVQIDPRYTMGWNGLGVIAANRRDFDLAAEYFAKALATAPNDQRLRKNLDTIRKLAAEQKN